MAYVIGTDEAGYGPNLGPLVIVATLWRTADDLPPAGFDECLQRNIDRGERIGGASGEGNRLVIADSKQVYHAGGSLAVLESGVLSAVATWSDLPKTGRALWASLAPGAMSQIAELPCQDTFDVELPTQSDIDVIDKHIRTLREAFATGQVCLERIAATALFPAEFNRRAEEVDSKGTVLSVATISLIAELLDSIDDGPVAIVCDKHGGRNRYGELLQQQFPDAWIEVRRESRPASIYRFGSPARRVEICFRSSGEQHAAAALASMTAKYLRELSMAAFNRFWRQHLPQVRPTAGYPLDARRFKAAIADVQRELKIDDQLLWRSR